MIIVVEERSSRCGHNTGLSLPEDMLLVSASCLGYLWHKLRIRQGIYNLHNISSVHSTGQVDFDTHTHITSQALYFKLAYISCIMHFSRSVHMIALVLDFTLFGSYNWLFKESFHN
jgi:hypothetical protein